MGADATASCLNKATTWTWGRRCHELSWQQTLKVSEATRVNVASSHWYGSQLQELRPAWWKGPAAKVGGRATRPEPREASQQGAISWGRVGEGQERQNAGIFVELSLNVAEGVPSSGTAARLRGLPSPWKGIILFFLPCFPLDRKIRVWASTNVLLHW